jgi:hypothetical protein
MKQIHANASRRWLAVLGLMFACGSAHAQATRTWVSGVGADDNPCSRTAPCRTFAGAIVKTAPGGTISVLDPGGFGTVTITKSITIDGGGIQGSILAANATGVVVNAAFTDVVTLRNLSIFGVGNGLNGVRVVQARAVHIENCIISGFRGGGMGNGNGILANPTTVGIKRIYVQDSQIEANGVTGDGGGIRLTPTAGMVLLHVDNTRIKDNLGYGIKVNDNAMATVTDSFILGNKRSGIWVISSSAIADVILHDNRLDENGWDTTYPEAAVNISGANAFVHLSGNVIANHDTGILRPSGHASTYGNNRMIGNTVNGTTDGADANL